jgi:tRNA dimethylallyltransferase
VNASTSQLAPLVVILGPTGSGKTALALDVAEHWSGEIVSCDSVQVYRGFDVGSAKLLPAERRGITHHLLDVAGPGETFTAGDYSRAGRVALRDIESRGKLPVVSGGTGFYLRALLSGLSPAPQRDNRLRDRLRRIAVRRPMALYRILARIDSEAAGRIHPNDIQKLIRAIEIAALSGKATTAVQSLPRDVLERFRILKIGLQPPRDELYDALNRRTIELFERGLVEETKELLRKGYAASSQPMQSLGYRQALNVISGRLSESEAVRECQLRTRQYAKRQLTWFRAERDVQWVPHFGSEASARRLAFESIGVFLATGGLTHQGAQGKCE